MVECIVIHRIGRIYRIDRTGGNDRVYRIDRICGNDRNGRLGRIDRIHRINKNDWIEIDRSGI